MSESITALHPLVVPSRFVKNNRNRGSRRERNGDRDRIRGGKKKEKKSKKPRTEQYKRAMIKEEKLIILASSWVSRSIPDILTLTKYKWAGITRNTKGREKK